MRKHIALCCFFALPSISIAAAVPANPEITKAEFANNETIIISGNNLGTENPMLFWDGVNNIDTLKLKSIVPSNTGDWRENTNQWGEPMIYDSLIINKDIKNYDSFYSGEGHKSFLGNPVYTNQPTQEINNKIYVSWWYKPGVSPSSEGGSNKFIRIWDNSNGLGTRISWTQMHITCGNSQNDEYVTWINWNGNISEWNHHEIFVDLTNNRVQTWLNGKLTATAKCQKDIAQLLTPLYVGLIGFDHGSAAYSKMTTAIDDIYIGSNPKRVVISNESLWSKSTTNTVLPVISWSNNKIVLKQVFGKVPTRKTKSYFYLFDEKGNLLNIDGIPLEEKSYGYFPEVAR